MPYCLKIQTRKILILVTFTHKQFQSGGMSLFTFSLLRGRGGSMAHYLKADVSPPFAFLSRQMWAPVLQWRFNTAYCYNQSAVVVSIETSN